MNTTILSSPNAMIWCHFKEARSILNTLASQKKDVDSIAEKIAVVVILLSAGVEAFLNIYFHIVAEKGGNTTLLQETLTGKRVGKKGEKYRISVRSKIETWPSIAYSKDIDKSSDVYKNFCKVVKLRNKLIHLKGDDKKIERDNVILQSLIDTSFFDNLKLTDGSDALTACEDIIGEIGLIAGQEKDSFLHSWTGKVPLYQI